MVPIPQPDGMLGSGQLDGRAVIKLFAINVGTELGAILDCKDGLAFRVLGEGGGGGGGTGRLDGQNRVLAGYGFVTDGVKGS
jgi:hypothetical protein